MDDRDEMLIVHELRRLRGAVVGLAVVVVLCTAAVVLALWNSELVVGVLILLGVMLVACIIGCILGAATGKAINCVREG